MNEVRSAARALVRRNVSSRSAALILALGLSAGMGVSLRAEWGARRAR